MPDIELDCEVVVVTGEGSTDHEDVIARKSFRLPLTKSDRTKAWVMLGFRASLAAVRDDQVVRGIIKGTSGDGSHSLACGTINGWKGAIQMRSGVFDR